MRHPLFRDLICDDKTHYNKASSHGMEILNHYYVFLKFAEQKELLTGHCSVHWFIVFGPANDRLSINQ